MERKSVLKELVFLKRNLNSIQKDLNTFDYDSDVLVVITLKCLYGALEKCLEKKVSFDELEQWANMIECRDDLGYEKVYEDVIKKYIDEIANPMLFGELNSARVEFLFSEISELIENS